MEDNQYTKAASIVRYVIQAYFGLYHLKKGKYARFPLGRLYDPNQYKI